MGNNPKNTIAQNVIKSYLKKLKQVYVQIVIDIQLEESIDQKKMNYLN